MPNLNQTSVAKEPVTQVCWESWEQRERVREVCRQNGWSLSWFIRNAVEKEMKRLQERD